MPLGSLVVDEQVFPISDVVLREGQVVVMAHLERGSQFRASGGEYRVHSDDGRLVWRGRLASDVLDSCRALRDPEGHLFHTIVLAVRLALNGGLTDSARETP